jgi:site-specific recombinase XerD
VRQDRRNKKSAYRWAGISPELWDFFKNSDIKFANIISYTTTLRAFFNQFFKFARENGFNGRLRPHILRHTAVYNLFKQGVSLEYIALIIGDEPRTVWEHYIKNNPDIIADALSKIKTPSVIQTNFSSPIFDKLN